MLTFERCSVVGKGVTTEAVFWIWGVFGKAIVEGVEGTIEKSMRVLKWSFHWLLLGEWPTHDWQGKKYPRSSEEGKKPALGLLVDVLLRSEKL